MTIYATKEWPGRVKHSYAWNEYRLESDRVVRYKCTRRKIFDGQENEWVQNERIEASWSIDDPNIPEWLKKHMP